MSAEPCGCGDDECAACFPGSYRRNRAWYHWQAETAELPDAEAPSFEEWAAQREADDEYNRELAAERRMELRRERGR